jgi:glycosyltransferase involved in cell wall biosynthesis
MSAESELIRADGARRPAHAALEGRRLVFVLPWAALAGAERQALNFARYLGSLGAHVEVCALTDHDGPAVEAFRASGIRWNKARVDWYGPRSRKARELYRLARALRSMRPDALLPYCTPANVLCGLVWRRTGAATCVWHQQDVLSSSFGHRLIRRALGRCPVVVSNSEHGLAHLRELGGSAGRMLAIPPFVVAPAARASRAEWRARLGARDGAALVCMLATLGPKKDHATLLRAWQGVLADLAPRGREALLLLAGQSVRGGGEAAKALAYDLDLGRSVRFLGYVDDVGGLLEASDVAVLSSRSEGLPNAVLEPMAKGLPVVATDIPGVREAVGPDGVALVAPPGDSVALARAIARAAEDEDLREEARIRNPASIARRFGPDRTAETYAAVVAGALLGRASGADLLSAQTGS